MNVDRWSRADAAWVLGVSVRTLDRWHRAGIGPPRIKVGGRVLYDPHQLRTWIERQGNSS